MTTQDDDDSADLIRYYKWCDPIKSRAIKIPLLYSSPAMWGQMELEKGKGK